NDLAFKNSYPPLEEVGDVKVKVSIAINVRLDRMLMQVLEPIQGVYMVRQGYLEITTFKDAMKEAGEINLDGGGMWRGYYESRGDPFVHVTFAGRSLTAILADLARQYGDQNIILAPQARGMAETKLFGRLVNLPLRRALQVAADLADLKCVAADNVCLITTKDRAEPLLRELSDRADIQRIQSELADNNVFLTKNQIRRLLDAPPATVQSRRPATPSWEEYAKRVQGR